MGEAPWSAQSAAYLHASIFGHFKLWFAHNFFCRNASNPNHNSDKKNMEETRWFLVRILPHDQDPRPMAQTNITTASTNIIIIYFLYNLLQWYVIISSHYIPKGVYKSRLPWNSFLFWTLSVLEKVSAKFPFHGAWWQNYPSFSTFPRNYSIFPRMIYLHFYSTESLPQTDSSTSVPPLCCHHTFVVHKIQNFALYHSGQFLRKSLVHQASLARPYTNYYVTVLEDIYSAYLAVFSSHINCIRPQETA